MALLTMLTYISETRRPTDERSSLLNVNIPSTLFKRKVKTRQCLSRHVTRAKWKVVELLPRLRNDWADCAEILHALVHYARAITYPVPSSRTLVHR